MKKFIALTFATLTVLAPFSMHATDADIDAALANLDVRDAVAMIEQTNSKIDFSSVNTGLEAETEAARQLTAANALAKKNASVIVAYLQDKDATKATTKDAVKKAFNIQGSKVESFMQSVTKLLKENDMEPILLKTMEDDSLTQLIARVSDFLSLPAQRTELAEFAKPFLVPAVGPKRATAPTPVIVTTPAVEAEDVDSSSEVVTSSVATPTVNSESSRNTTPSPVVESPVISTTPAAIENIEIKTASKPAMIETKRSFWGKMELLGYAAAAIYCAWLVYYSYHDTLCWNPIAPCTFGYGPGNRP